MCKDSKNGYGNGKETATFMNGSVKNSSCEKGYFVGE